MKLDSRVGWASLIQALFVGCAFGILTFAIPGLSVLSSNSVVATLQQLASNLLWPGLLCAFAASGNVHAWHLWIAAMGNFVFYFGVTLVLGALWRKFRSGENRRFV